MQAEWFYQQEKTGAIPMIFLTEAACSIDSTGLDKKERTALATHRFKGCIGDAILLLDTNGCAMKAYVGLGDGKRQALAVASAATRLPPGVYQAMSPLATTAKAAWALAQYRFDVYKKNEHPPCVLVLEIEDWADVLAEASTVFLVRDLINRPANEMGPSALASVLKQIAEAHGAVFQEWVGDELLRAHFPAIHAVGRAAKEAPRLLSLEWGCSTKPCVTLIGKGVCFDSGGLDIKPSSGMRLMKKDMGGAAQVIGLASWVMTHQLPIQLKVLIPAVENAISSESYRPGDILTMRNGMTVEIHNTDAEGRLILADALVKASEEHPALIIDFATLTGAARVSVGTEIAAMFTNEDSLADALMKVGEEMEDPLWRLPLFEPYGDLFTSSIADLSNASASPYAGAITAALFLKHFVKTGIPWVHFDIMAWNISNKPGRPEGGEAMGIRAVGQYLMRRYKA